MLQFINQTFPFFLFGRIRTHELWGNPLRGSKMREKWAFLGGREVNSPRCDKPTRKRLSHRKMCFFSVKIIIFSSCRLFHFNCKNNDFWVYAVAKRHFFAPPTAALTKILNICFLVDLSSRQKEAKISAFLVQRGRFTDSLPEIWAYYKKFCENLTFWILDAGVLRMRRQFCIFWF